MARKVFSSPQSALAAPSQTTALGTAAGDSVGGMVPVYMDAEVITDERNPDDTQAIMVPTTQDAREGDSVIVGIDGTGHSVVTGVIGSGDRTKADVKTVADSLAETDSKLATVRSDADAHEAEIANVKKDIADYKKSATATYATKTEVDEKTGAITKTLTADYKTWADTQNDIADNYVGITQFNNTISDAQQFVAQTYSEKTELTEAVNQLSSTMSSQYTAFTDYRKTNDTALSKAQSDATNAQREIAGIKTDYATKSELKATDTELSGKVSDALTTAKSYTDSSVEQEVTARNAAIKAQADSISLDVSRTYTKSETFSAYQTDADGRIATAKSTADAAKASIDGLEIGGRNLVQFSDFSGFDPHGVFTVDGDVATATSSAVGNTNNWQCSLARTSTDYITTVRNKRFTFSMDYWVTEAITYGTTKPFIGAQLWVEYTPDGSTTNKYKYFTWYGDDLFPTAVTSGWVRTSITHTFPDATIVASGFSLYFRDCKGTAKFRHPKLELGNKPTDWTPAPEDIEQTYATQASLKVQSDRITAEVTERTKLSGRVGTLESTSSEHTTKITQLSSSIESMVKGEATYTAPDGTTKTNGLYSKIEQTANGINETFGQYTKTEDLASTAAVKDAKKAGTDAASAASAAQSTADAAKTAAANAQSTANAAKGTADGLATLIRKDSTGVTVGYTTDGTTFTQGRTHMGQSSFDVLDADGNTTASLAKDQVSLLGGLAKLTATQETTTTEQSGQLSYDVLKINSQYEMLRADHRANISAECSGTNKSGVATNSTAGITVMSYDDTSKTVGASLMGYVSDTDTTDWSLNSASFQLTPDEFNVQVDAVTTSKDLKVGGVAQLPGGLAVGGGTKLAAIYSGTTVVNSLGSDFDLFSGDDCKSRFGELVMPDEHASWVLLASPGQASYDHHITLSPTSGGGVHGYITPSVKGNIRVQWVFIKF